MSPSRICSLKAAWADPAANIGQETIFKIKEGSMYLYAMCSGSTYVFCILERCMHITCCIVLAWDYAKDKTESLKQLKCVERFLKEFENLWMPDRLLWCGFFKEKASISYRNSFVIFFFSKSL